MSASPEPVRVQLDPQVTLALFKLQSKLADLLMEREVMLDALLVTRSQLRVIGPGPHRTWERVVEHAIQTARGPRES